MSTDVEQQLIATAELVNAPNSGFAEHSLSLLRKAEDLLGDNLRDVYLEQRIALLGIGLAEIAAWITITSRDLAQEHPSDDSKGDRKGDGGKQAVPLAELNEALAATAAAYGALSRVYRECQRGACGPGGFIR